MKTNQISERRLQSHRRGWVLVFSTLLLLLFAGSSAQAQDVYKVTMTRTGVEGLTTDCSTEGYVLAHGESGHLTANGSDLEADGTLGPALQVNIGNDGTPVAWSRTYDAGDGLSGVFNGCFGGPSGPTGYSGALFIFFEGKGSRATVRFTWHFDYYITPTVREHFSLLSEKMSFPAWTGGNIPPTMVRGNFDFLHYLKDGSQKVKNYYTPIPGGQDRWFEFNLSIEKVESGGATTSPRTNPVSAQSGEATKPRIAEAYGKLPLSFEANQGQTNSQVEFLSRGSGYTLFLSRRGDAILALRKTQAKTSVLTESRETPAGAVVQMKLVGANPTPQVEGLDPLPGKSNYFIGNDPKQWRKSVPNYAKVRYREVYPGVDLVYYGNQRQLEYDFVVAPGADPKAIKLSLDGAKDLRVDDSGDLVITVEEEEIRFRKPLIYQEVGDVRKETSGGYVVSGEHQVGFHVDDYDASKPLVIDPILAYSTYLGGSDHDDGCCIAVDSSGNACVTGQTSSPNFPTAGPFGPFQAAMAGWLDVFVAKLNADGSALVYSTFLGGPQGGHTPYALAIDSSGNAYVTGWLDQSFDFPTTAGAYKTAIGPVATPGAFVTKLNADGSALVYSTYLGASATSVGIAVDSSGNAYVTGDTNSLNFPVKNPFQATNAGGFDAFVTKLNADGSALVYSTYLGGSGSDSGFGIAVDSSGNTYVTGQTSSPNFPTENPFQATNAGGFDAFVTKLNADGSALVYSTYLGGAGGPCGPYIFQGICDNDAGSGIAVDPAGNAYVVGGIESTSFPTANPLQAVSGGGGDGFVTKLNAAGNALVYSTYLGSSSRDYAVGIAVDSDGNAYVAGWVSGVESSNFPVTTGAFQGTFGGNWDAFVLKISPDDNTPAGADVVTPLTNEVTLTFDNVTAPGTTSLTEVDSGPAPPAGFSLGDPATYFELTTTASFTGLITVCINYSSISYTIEADLRLFHFEGGVWVDQTASLDTVNNIICALVSSLSPFAVFSSPLQVAGLQPPLGALVPEGDTPPLPNKAFKQGSTLPLKIQLSTGSVILTDQNSAPPRIVALSRSAEVIALEAIDLNTGEANDNNLVFRYADGEWVYNLGTRALSTGTYTITIQMPDGLRYTAGFVLR